MADGLDWVVGSVWIRLNGSCGLHGTILFTAGTRSEECWHLVVSVSLLNREGTSWAKVSRAVH